MSEPYHRFVFDLERRQFVGRFEEMYDHEEAEGYDSWHQDAVDTLARRVALAVLASRPWSSILDFGCGKGAFTNLLKTDDNRVVGVDAAPTAIAKASARDPRVEFRHVPGGAASLEGERFELVLAMEVLSYLEDWRETLRLLTRIGGHVFVSLYLPPDPIGFVKSLEELREEIERHCEIEVEVLLDRQQLLVLARSR